MLQLQHVRTLGQELSQAHESWRMLYLFPVFLLVGLSQVGNFVERISVLLGLVTAPATARNTNVEVEVGVGLPTAEATTPAVAVAVGLPTEEVATPAVAVVPLSEGAAYDLPPRVVVAEAVIEISIPVPRHAAVAPHTLVAFLAALVIYLRMMQVILLLLAKSVPPPPELPGRRTHTSSPSSPSLRRPVGRSPSPRPPASRSPSPSSKGTSLSPKRPRLSSPS